jgi:glyoxylase-like metal-dependent hydrolase (beta-lactamase superfamily II)/8-oxo-dGTP pyrophosphatase MutT (NUDIX family)
MSELPPGVPPAAVPEPKDSACGIVCRRASDGWRVLVGLRSRASRFMPDHVAFPGGRLDAADEPGRPGAFARCVAREVREETGVRVPPEAWLDAGVRVTPPLFPVRFRTEFLVAAMPEGAPEIPVPATPENEELRVVPAARVLEEWARGVCKVPPPVLPILRALAVGPDSLESVARAVTRANREEERAPRIEFVPDVWVFPARTRTLPPATHTNVWIAGGRRFVVIDPGSDDPAEIDRMLAVVDRRLALGHRPAAIVLTHHHGDHVSGAAATAQALGVPVLAHRETLRLGPAVPRAEPLADGDTVDLDGMTLRALETPGHAAGHLAFHLPEAEVVVAGDLLSGLSTILIDPETGDMDSYIASLERMGRTPCRLVLPAHGPPVPPVALGQLVEHRRQRETRILARLSEAEATLAEVATTAYDQATVIPRALIERQTLAHLVALERRGRVRRRGNVWMSDSGEA